MAYQVPKCECGAELLYEEDIGYTEVYRINKNGLKSKKKLKMYRGEEFLRSRLQCHECDNYYEIDGSIDDGFKIRRGGLIQ